LIAIVFDEMRRALRMSFYVPTWFLCVKTSGLLRLALDDLMEVKGSIVIICFYKTGSL
jgi:hypothetical protein